MAASRVLVVYYSRTGGTRRLGQAISNALHGDIEEIAEARSRAGAIGYIRSLVEAMRKHAAPIAPAKKDPASYDLVVIGTPVWAGSVSAPVRSYLAASRARLPKVAFFCTLGGRGSESAFGQMQDLVGKAPRARCVATARDVRSDRCGALAAQFAQQLGIPPSSAAEAATREPAKARASSPR